MEREDMAVDRKNATGFLHFRVSFEVQKCIEDMGMDWRLHSVVTIEFHRCNR